MPFARSSLARLVALAAGLVLAGCGGGGGGGEAAPPPTTAPPTGGETTTEDTTAARPPEPRRLRVERVASGLGSPTHATAAPGEPGRIYVVEQAGTIRVVEDGSVRRAPFLDIVDLVESGGEQGLLSVAFHPEYAENGRLYVDYTNREGDTRVVEYRADAERTAVDEGSARELLAVEQPFPNHNGGQLAFGPDGLLYVGMGDGGAGGDPDDRAQDLGDRLGKLLRLDVDDPGAEWEVVAYGLRNPWRFSFDRSSGDLYLADVGEQSREEVNYVAWPLGGLLNFGWDVFEGDLPYERKPLNEAGRLVRPAAVYGGEGGCSVTGGFVYRGEAMPGLQGRYFYGDFCSGSVWSLRIRNGRAQGLRRERFQVDAISSFGEDPAGELLLVSLTGTVYRLAA